MGTGYTGGDPDVLSGAAERLSQAADALESVVAPFVSATGAAVDVAGAPTVYVAVARLRATWGSGLTELASQVRAVGVVAQAAGADLDAAGGE